MTAERRIDVLGFGRGKENVAEIKGADFDHFVSKRALKGRVLPDKVKKPHGLAVPQTPAEAGGA